MVWCQVYDMAACDTLQHAMRSHGMQGQAHCQEQAPNSTPRYQRCVCRIVNTTSALPLHAALYSLSHASLDWGLVGIACCIKAEGEAEGEGEGEGEG
jgi:hypothetical protein